MAEQIKYVSVSKLGYYDEKIKDYIANADEAVKTALQENIDAEITRAKAAEATNALAAQNAQNAADTAQADVNTLVGKVGTVPEGSTVMDIIANIQENAYDDTEIRGLISNLDTNKANKTQVATDIAAAVKVEEEARIAAINGVQGNVNTLSQTHATDKKDLEDAIALKADITALNEVSAVANAAVKQADYDVKVKALEDEDARIVSLVEAEAERAGGVEADLEERLVEVETFFKTTEGETLDQALDTLVEIQKYITDEGSAADQMVLDIAANTKAIEDHIATNHDFAAADATLKSELEGKINAKADKTVVEGIDGRVEVVEGKVGTLEGKVSTLEGEMNAVEGAVATKAEQSALEEAIEALEGADAGQVERIAALEAKFGDGEGNVEDMIATAKQEAINTAAGDATTKANTAEANAKTYVDGEIDKVESAINTLEGVVNTKAAQADLTALTTRVTTAEGEIDTLQSEMDAVEALAAANKAAQEANAAAIALKASQADLEALESRVDAVEEWQANMVECEVSDINALFA